MKKEKLLVETQARARATAWPDASEQDAFAELSRDVRDVIVTNLGLHALNDREFRESWKYRAEIGTWQFELTESFMVEVKPGAARCGEVRQTFHVEKTWVTADIKHAISLIADDIKTWRGGLREMRKLQLKRVLETEGLEAYEAAVGRE